MLRAENPTWENREIVESFYHVIRLRTSGSRIIGSLFCNLLLRKGKTGQTRFGAGITHSNGSAVTHFPKYRHNSAESEPHTLGFCAANNFPCLQVAIGAPEVDRENSRAAAIIFSEPCGLENTHDVVMHVHYSSLALQTSAHKLVNTFRKFEIYTPAIVYFPQFWLKQRPRRGGGSHQYLIAHLS